MRSAQPGGVTTSLASISHLALLARRDGELESSGPGSGVAKEPKPKPKPAQQRAAPPISDLPISRGLDWRGASFKC